MTPEQELATRPLARPAEPAEPVPTDQPGTDPLERITLTPRRFVSVLATAGLLLGLLLALVPVRVASLDTTTATSVSCGNTIGGAETPLIAGSLDTDDPAVLATYVGTCQQAIGTRLLFAWPMFFAGMLGIVWLGVVRREPAVTAPAPVSLG